MLESYQRINQAVGVSIDLLAEGKLLINACSIAIKDGKLDIEKKLIDIDELGGLKKHFPEKSYIALNLNGKGVLHKQIERVEQIDQNNFNQILPNANADDFYIQNLTSADKSFVSVIRKSEADKYLALLKELGFSTLLLCLGPFPVYHIASQLNVYDDELIFNGHIINRDEEAAWVSYKYNDSAVTPFPLKIESELLDEKLLIAYASAFQLALGATLTPIKADAPVVDNAFETTIANFKLKVKGFVILTLFFVALLVNFFLFSWFNSTNAELTERVSRTAQSTSNLQDISKTVESKEILLKALGWDGGVKKSMLIDQLAALLPPDVTWREIAINPIDQSTGRTQKTLVFMDGTIKVTGNSEKIIPVNEWIARIKTYKWIKGVQLESYTFDSERNTGQFIVLINY